MGVGKSTGVSAAGILWPMVPRACILYFADIKLARYIRTHIPEYISMHVQCLGEGRKFFF